MLHDPKKIFDEDYAAIYKTWHSLVLNGHIDKEIFTINLGLLSKALNHYIEELEITKIKYGIEELAISQKFSALIATSLLKFKPVIPQNGNFSKKIKYGDNDVYEYLELVEPNEMLALFHGLNVCINHYNRYYEDQDDQKTLKDLICSERFLEWRQKYLFLLRERCYTPDSLIMAFEGFCLAAFPNGLEKEIREEAQRKLQNSTSGFSCIKKCHKHTECASAKSIKS